MSSIRTLARHAAASLMTLALVLPSGRVAWAQADTPGSDAVDAAVVERCANTLTEVLGIAPSAPEFSDTLTLCYAVETGPGPKLGPPTYAANDVVTSYFGPGSVGEKAGVQFTVGQASAASVYVGDQWYDLDL